MLVVVVAAACDKKEATNTPEPAASPRQTTAAPAPAPEHAPEYSGTPVAVIGPKVLHESPGFRVESQQWKLGGTEGIAWRARLSLDAEVALSVADDVTPFRKLWPKDDGPWVAINGGFYEAVPDSETYRPMGLVVSNATEVAGLTRRGGSGVFYVDEEGPAVVHRREFASAPTVALQSIDRIVSDGDSVVRKKPGATGAPRSAVVVGESHLWFVITAASDDVKETPNGARLSSSDSGMPLWAFAEYVLDTTDARDALNLDGGVSTQLAVRDDDFKLYVYGVRGTLNALVARPAGPSEE